MGTGVFFNVPAHGHINPTLPVVKELISRGEKIIYFSTEEFKEKIERSGAEFRAYDFEMPKGAKGLGTGGNFVRLTRFLLRATEEVMAQNLDSIRQLKPDYILHDSMCPWGKYIAQYLGIKAVNTTSTFVFTQNALNRSGEFVFKILKMAYEEGTAGILQLFKARRNLVDKYRIKTDIMDLFRNVENLNLVFTSQYFQPDYHGRRH